MKRPHDPEPRRHASGARSLHEPLEAILDSALRLLDRQELDECARAEVEQVQRCASALLMRFGHVDTHPVVDDPPARRAGDLPAGEAEDGRPLVLILGGDPETIRFIGEELHPQFRTATAPVGHEHLPGIAEMAPDVILIDGTRSGESALALIRCLRMSSGLEAVPAIALTDPQDRDFRISMLRGGASDNLTLPLLAEELRVRVRTYATVKRIRDLLQSRGGRRSARVDGPAAEAAESLCQLVDELESEGAALRSADAHMQSRSEFLRLMSHELRTPLATLQLQLDLFRRTGMEELSERQVRAIDRIAVSSRRLRFLVDSLMSYARVERERFKATCAPVELTQTMPELAAEACAQAGHTADFVVLRFCDVEPVVAVTDGQALGLIILNLLDAGLKASQRGPVELSVRREGAAILIEVGDAGEVRDREPQPSPVAPVRPMEEDDTGRLQGLGVIVAQLLAGALGGQVQVERSGCGGVTFRLSLPG